MTDYAAYFALLQQNFPNYQSRPGQIELSNAIAKNIAAKSFLLAEAGTGTGKTLAYLLPAVIEDKKILISTASKTLQEQIVNKDLPIVQKITSKPLSAVLLKGRNNYLCLLHQQELFSTESQSNQERIYRRQIDKFLKTTIDGDLALLKGVPEYAPILSAITCTHEDCPKKLCPLYEECFFYRARNRAKAADIVVINHHLLTAELLLHDEINAGLLPTVDGYLIDEAHKFPDAISNAMTIEVSLHRLKLYVNALGDFYAGKFKGLAIDLVILNTKIAEFSLFLSDKKQLTTWEEAINIHTELKAWGNVLAEKIIPLLTNELTELIALNLEVDEFTRIEISSKIDEVKRFLQRTLRLCMDLEAINAPNPERAFWIEAQKNGFKAYLAPILVADIFQRWTEKLDAAWTFLSATLSINERLEFFAARLGITEFEIMILPSPFNYPLQSILYHPPNLPEPNQENYMTEFMKSIHPVLEITNGRAFLLFTSYAAMYRAKEFFERGNFDFLLLVQGEMSKVEILEKFRSEKRAILLATASFWEGVDVSGKALVCVVIDKLPFESPVDAIVKARHEYLKKQGKNPFTEDSLPQAIMTLKQGVGRLIRDASDYGVLVIGDPRLTTKNYGKQILANLPPMTCTQKFERVQHFFYYHENTTSY